MQTRLILIEGIPGSGKTTLTKRLDRALEKNAGLRSRAFCEGSVFHPMDHGHLAYFSHDGYTEFWKGYPDIMYPLIDNTIVGDGWALVPYREYGHDIYRGQLQVELEQRELCGRTPVVSMTEFQRIFAQRWAQFVEWFHVDVVVMESTFLHQPVCDLLRLYDASPEQIVEWLGSMAQEILSLDPALFYIAQKDVAESLARTAQERDEPNLASDESIAFWTRQKAIDFAAMASLPIRSHVVDNSLYDWDHVLRVILAALGLPEAPSE